MMPSANSAAGGPACPRKPNDLSISDGTGNPAMLAAYRNLEVIEVMNRELADAKWIQGDIADEHLAIVEAVADRDKARAAELIRAHNTHAIDTMHRAIDDEAATA